MLDNLRSAAACDELMGRAADLVDSYDGHHRSVFTTDEQARHADDKFLESGGTIDFFWEAEALDDEGQVVVDKRVAFNKMGHAAHDLDPVFDRFSRQDPLPELVADLGLRNPRLLQSMLILEHAGIGGEVVSHQDATFLSTDPITVIGLWFALEDATIENGCLPALDDPTLVPLEVSKGACVVLHGLLPHGSHPNRSSRSRQAYSVHLIDGSAEYPADNWLQRPDLPLRGFRSN